MTEVKFRFETQKERVLFMDWFESFGQDAYENDCNAVNDDEKLSNYGFDFDYENKIVICKKN